MSDDIIDFIENIVGIKLNDCQKEILLKLQDAKDNDKELFMCAGRKQGMTLINSILFSFNILQKVKQMNDLQSQLDQQKAMWNELKEFVGKYADNYDESISSICYLILDKIKELEQGEKDD